MSAWRGGWRRALETDLSLSLTWTGVAGQPEAMPASESPARPARPRPALTDRGQQQEAERRGREAAALRENLIRRKQQQRARRASGAPGGRKDGD
jgi:hypothetical protein